MSAWLRLCVWAGLGSSWHRLAASSTALKFYLHVSIIWLSTSSFQVLAVWVSLIFTTRTTGKHFEFPRTDLQRTGSDLDGIDMLPDHHSSLLLYAFHHSSLSLSSLSLLSFSSLLVCSLSQRPSSQVGDRSASFSWHLSPRSCFLHFAMRWCCEGSLWLLNLKLNYPNPNSAWVWW